MMKHTEEDSAEVLEALGLSPVEAQIYLSLARTGAPMRASAIVAAASVPRGSIYPALTALAQKGIIQNGQGYGSEFAALPARQALPRLIAAEKAKLSKAESLTRELIKNIEARGHKKQNGLEGKLIEVLRDPEARGERFQQLQREVQSEVNTLARWLPGYASRCRTYPARFL